jgi:ppGpp synthetase/RelA/SpoT-type nucleotidyltranferase
MITKEKINQVGKYLIVKNNIISEVEANDVLKNFRLIHQHPMILFRHTIERKLKKHDITTALVSQRLKRIPSIIKKLKIQKNMNLSRMQDIGGLRIVVKTIKEVNLIRKELKKTERHSNFKFTFANEKNYITNPPKSGYRSIHMVYKYDKDIDLNKQCRVEIQIRTQLQHYWATAVEVTGTYRNESLKQGDGDEKYLNIFKKISKLFISIETKKIDYEFIKEVKQDIEKIELLKKLQSFNIVSRHLESNDKEEYVLLKMNFKKEQIEIAQYSRAKFEQANKDYLKMEMKYFANSTVEIVLISIQDIKKLKQYYPNYFMDTTEFIKNINALFKSVLGGKKLQPVEIMSKNITQKMLKLFNEREK